MKIAICVMIFYLVLYLAGSLLVSMVGGWYAY